MATANDKNFSYARWQVQGPKIFESTIIGFHLKDKIPHELNYFVNEKIAYFKVEADSSAAR